MSNSNPDFRHLVRRVLHSRLGRAGLIAASLLIFALAMTWPLARYWTGGIWGILHDGIDSEWRIWAYRQVWLGRSTLNPFLLQYVPQGVPFLGPAPMYTSEALLALASFLPMHAIPAYNTLMIAKFLLAGGFMVALLRRCRLNPWAVAFGTLAYLMNPYLMSTVRAYGPNYLSAGLPALAWAAVYLADRRRAALGSPLRMLAVLAVVILALGENFYYSYYGLAAASLAGVAYLLMWGKRRYGIVALVALVSSATFIHKVAMIAGAKDGRVYDAASAIRYSSHPWFYFVPAIDHRLWGAKLASLYWKLKGEQDTFEMSQYLGLCVAALAVFAVVRSSRLTPKHRRATRYFALVATLALLAALGPLSAALGSYSPGLVLFEIAPMFRHLSRFQLIVGFSLSVMAAIGFNALFTSPWFQFPKTRRLTQIALLALLIVEFWSGGSSRFVQNIRQRLPSAYAALAELPPAPIIESPAHFYRAMILMRTFQTIHNLPTEGTVESPSRYHWDSPEEQQAARAAGFRYWVIHKDMGPIVTGPFNDGADESWGDRRVPDVNHFAFLKRLHHGADSELFEITDSFDVDQPVAFHRAGFYLNHDQDSDSRWTNAPTSALDLWYPTGLLAARRGYEFKFKARSMVPRSIAINCGATDRPTIFKISAETNEFSLRCPAPTTQRSVLTISDSQAMPAINQIVGGGDDRRVGTFLGAIQISAI